MAKANVKPVEVKPDIVLEMSYEEAQAVRDLIGWKVDGTTSGRRRLLAEVYKALEPLVETKGSGDMSGHVNFY